MIFFTGDLHFYHKLAASMREYDSVEDMNNEIIHRLNLTLYEDDDELYILGDLSFGNITQTNDILEQLPFKKYLILGNHDNIKKLNKLAHHFEWIKDYYKLRITEGDIKYRLILSHYPMMTWENAHHGSWMLHGHCHGNLKAPETTRIDVGWDVFKRPVGFPDIKFYMQNRKYITVDHHD